MLEQGLACRAALFRLEARPRSGLLSACWPAVCAVVEVALRAVLHARTHQHHTHTHVLHRHFWGARKDISACVQHRAVGAAPPSDTALAAGEASPMATDDPPAAPVPSADTVPAGSASAVSGILAWHSRVRQRPEVV